MRDRLRFGGVRGTETDTEIPDAYTNLMDRHGADSIGSLENAIHYLGINYPAEWRDLYYNASKTADEGTMFPKDVENYRAVVNPNWTEGSPDDVSTDDGLWYIPTTQYTLLQHDDILSPLVDAVERVDPETVFGSLRTRRDGAEVHLDVFFQNVSFGVHDDESITLGISTGNDYKQNVSLYVDVVGFLDTDVTDVGNVMRYLVDRESRKHTGSASDDIVDFYEAAVRQLSESTDELRTAVSNAMHHTVSLSEIPVSVFDFYRKLGLPDREPNRVATPAGDRLVEITPTEINPTAWHLYKAGMWAIENEYDPRDTTAFKNHVANVNTLLLNPKLAERRVLSEIEGDLLEAKAEDSHEITEFIEDEDSSIDDELETVRTRAKTVSEGVAEFENVRDRISSLLTDEGTEERVPEDEDDSSKTVRTKVGD